MVLSKASISARKLISGEVSKSLREGSYDLTIKDFITPDGKVVGEYLLPAQGIVKVVSAEEVRLPADVIGYVLVKTKLCNEGVLALNIGIVDPGFEGPLQSALINFGKSDIRLHAGEVFSRITFHTLDVLNPDLQPTRFDRESVRRETQMQMDRYLGATFLDIPKTAEKAAEKAFGDFKSAMLKYVPALALAIAMMTFMLNFGNMWLLYAYMKPQDTVRAESLWRATDERVKKLEEENVSLKQALTQPSVARQTPQPVAKGAAGGTP